jgi:hypothetical protein
MDSLSATMIAGLSVLSLMVVRRVRAAAADVAGLAERVSDLARRLEAAEHDIAGALARTEVAETVLLEKGIADEDDLEAARLRSGADVSDGPTDELH